MRVKKDHALCDILEAQYRHTKRAGPSKHDKISGSNSQLILSPRLWVADDVPGCPEHLEGLSCPWVFVLVWMDLCQEAFVNSVSLLYTAFLTYAADQMKSDTEIYNLKY